MLEIGILAADGFCCEMVMPNKAEIIQPWLPEEKNTGARSYGAEQALAGA
jgi:hypothetical protein